MRILDKTVEVDLIFRPGGERDELRRFRFEAHEGEIDPRLSIVIAFWGLLCAPVIGYEDTYAV